MTRIFEFGLPTLQTFTTALALVFIAATLSTTPVVAAGSPSTSSPPPKCKAGYVWSTSKKKCIKKTSSLMNDEDLYIQARAFVEDKNYAEALELLQRIKNQNQPKVLNYIGFSTRKLGDVDKGITFYKKALALDPNYNIAREYLGEGYLQKGDLKSAKQQLAEISKRCGTSCEAYEDLAEEIAKYQAGNKAKTL